jgi:hypothetical protein
MKEKQLSSYNLTKIASAGNRTLLIIIGQDQVPMVSVFDEHEGQTLLRMCVSNTDNLKLALNILEKEQT